MAAIKVIQVSFGTCLSSPIQISTPFPGRQEKWLPVTLRFSKCRYFVKFSASTSSETLLSPSTVLRLQGPRILQSPGQHERLLCDIYPLIAANRDELYSFLRFSVSGSRVDVARASHAVLLKLFQEDTHLRNSLLSTYVKLNRLRDAYKVFLSLPFPDVASYSSLISGFAKSGLEYTALELFSRMRDESIDPNEYTFVAILTACTKIFDVELGSQVHGLLLKLGFLDCVFVGNALMCLYRECGFLEMVIQVFDHMPLKDTVSWNTIISSLIKEGCYEESFEIFRDMVASWNTGVRTDELTLSTALAACTSTLSLAMGREIHSRIIRIGLESGLSVGNALIGLYIACGSINEAVRVFERMQMADVITWTELIVGYMKYGMVDQAIETFQKMRERNSVTYNAMIAGFCQNNQPFQGLNLFVQMIREGIKLSDVSLTCITNACGLVGERELSRQIQGFITKIRFQHNECVEGALIDMCTRCGRMKEAEKMFQKCSSEKCDPFIQTSLLCGYSRLGMPDEAMSLFLSCHSDGSLAPDEILLSSVLGVCAALGIEKVGMQIHCLAIKTSFASDIGVGNSLISMYSKCCSMKAAIQSFNSLAKHDIISWNCLLSGYVNHRQGDDAISIWSKLEQTDIKPDSITLALVLLAYRYTNSNRLDQCCSLFDSMKRIYGIDPNLQHYVSLVSVLGFWGRLKEAENIILQLPFEPDAAIWRALLDNCRLHTNNQMGERIIKRILSIEPRDSSSFVLHSNLYAASGLWQKSETTRNSMKERGLQKLPCRSWIFIDNKIHFFYVRDKSHPQAEDIYSSLNILIIECLKVGYEPDTSFVLHELEEYQKKDFLFYHSAKLAATYGILTSRPGETIHIMKNVLLCGDCHSFLKFLSSVTRRNIVVRDTSGFHSFSNGVTENSAVVQFLKLEFSFLSKYNEVNLIIKEKHKTVHSLSQGNSAFLLNQSKNTFEILRTTSSATY